MPVYQVKAPNGKIYKVNAPEGARKEDLFAYVQQQMTLDSLIPPAPKEQAGFWGAFKDSIATLGLADEAAAFAANPTAENREAFLNAAESKYRYAGGFGTGENWNTFKELLGGSLGALVAPIATGVVGAGAGPAGAIGGFAGTSAAQYSIQNLQRQAEELQKASEAGLPVEDVDLGKAAIASAAQAGLDVIPGALILKGLRKFPLAQRLFAEDKMSEQAADILIDAFQKGNISRTGSVVKGVGLGASFEIPQEIAQQALERWQAGLSLTDDEAKEEFKQAAIGAAILGGAFGAVGGYATYRGTRAEGEQVIGGVEEDAEIEAQREEELRRMREGEIEDETLREAPPPQKVSVEDEDAEIEAQRQAEFEQMRQAEEERLLLEEAGQVAPRRLDEQITEQPQLDEELQRRLDRDQAKVRSLRLQDLRQQRPDLDSGTIDYLIEQGLTDKQILKFQLPERRGEPLPYEDEEGAEITVPPAPTPTESTAPAPSTEGALEGLGAPVGGGIPAEMFEPSAPAKPEVFYHGTQRGEFPIFDPTIGFTAGSWFTKDKTEAEKIGPAKAFTVDVKSPASMQDFLEARKEVAAQGLDIMEDRQAFNAAVIKNLEAKGFDGIRDKNFKGAGGVGEDVVAAFRPEQITPVEKTGEPTAPARDPREVALEVIKTTPTIKAISEATGLNQPKAAAIMRGFVDEGIVERVGNKFRLITPEATDVPSAAVTTTKTDTGAGRRGTTVPPSGEAATEPSVETTEPAGLDFVGDTTERADVGEGDVSAPLETEGVLEGGPPLPTDVGLPSEAFDTTRAAPQYKDFRRAILNIAKTKGAAKPEDLQAAFDIPLEDATRMFEAALSVPSFKKQYDKAVEERSLKADLRTRALDFIRRTGKGSAIELQNELGIPLNQAKALRNSLLGSGAVVQKTNVRAAKTAKKSYFVVEGDYKPEAGYRRETGAVEATTPKPEPIKKEKKISRAEIIRRRDDVAAEIEAKSGRKLPPTLNPEIGKGEYGLRYTDTNGNPAYQAFESAAQRSEARARLASEGNRDFSTFSRMAEAAKFELAYARGRVTPAMSKKQVAEAVRAIRNNMQKFKVQIGLFTEDEAPTPKKPVPKRVTRKEVVDYAKEVIKVARESGKLKQYNNRISAILYAAQQGEGDLRNEFAQLQRIEANIRKSEAELGEAKQEWMDEYVKGEGKGEGKGEDRVKVKERDEETYAPLDFRRLRFQKSRNPQIDTPQFKKWFGKSEIVNDVGDAAVWYTGSPVTDIEAFRTGTAEAIFASPNPNVANEFTFNRQTLGEGVVYPVYIRAEYPFDYENPTHIKNLFDKLLENAGTNTGFRNTILNLRKRIEEGAWQEMEMPIVQRAIKALGHDGFYVNEYRSKNLGVYNPNQIKSAVGNVGTFSQKDNRILFQKTRSQTVGMRAGNVSDLIGKITSRWKNPPNFVVVQSYLDLPEIEGVDPESNANTVGIAIGDTVYIVADNVRSVRDLKATVFHESLGHYGLEQLFGERLFQTMLDIYRTNARMRADADAWLAENSDTYPPSDFTQEERQALAVEEVFAEMSESGPPSNAQQRAAFNRVAALIRKFARALGKLAGVDLSYTNAEINAIVSMAHERVIFGRTRLIPRYNNIRYMKSTYTKVLTDAMRRVQSGAPSATKRILEGNINALSNLPRSMRRFRLRVLSLHHIMQLYERYAPALRRLNILVERMAKDATDEMVEHIKKSNAYRKVLREHADSVDEFNDVAHLINLSQTPVLEPVLNANMEFVRFKPSAAAKRMLNIQRGTPAYDALNAADKVLHNAVNRFYRLPQAMQDMMVDVYTDYRKYSDQAFKVKLDQFLSKLPPEVVAKIRKKFMDNRLTFYLPLRREGAYKLSYKNKNGVDVSKFFTSEAARTVGKEKAQQEGGQAFKESMVGENSYPEGFVPTGLLGELAKNVEDALKAAKVSDETIQETRELIFDTFIDYIPGTYGNDLRQEASGRAAWEFNGVTYYGRLGFEEDVIGIYESTVPRMLYQINNLKYTMPIEKTREKIKEQLAAYKANRKLDPKYKGIPEIDDTYVDDLIEDMDARIRFAKNPIYSNYVYRIAQANYIYSIAANVSSALINMTIVPMMAWPSLAAKYGVVDASRAIAQATKLFFRNGYRDPKTGKLQFNISPTFGNGATGELADFHRMLEMRSVTGTSAEQEINQAQNIEVPGYEGLSAKVNLAMSYVFRSSERYNREVTSLAAYMLARNVDAEGNTFNSSRQGVSVGRAAEEAIRLNYDVNGATLPETNSRLYQTDIGRIILTFRTHALNMLINLATTFNQAIRVINENEPNADQRRLVRNMAVKKLLYIYGSTYMLAGLKGLPLFGAAEVLASLVMGDDDEPYDLEQKVLDSVGTLGVNGPVNELLNIDIASRTGFYGLLWRDDPKRLAEVGIPVYVLERAIGPTYGLVEAARRGFNDFSEGEIQRGFEAILPAPLRNMLKGTRYATEGALTRDGLPITEDVSAYNSLMQVLGFAPADLAATQGQRGATYEISEKLKQRRVSLLTNLYAARKAGNSEALEKAMADIRKFNGKNPAYQITMDSINRSFNERERRAREAIMGIYQPKNLRAATAQYVTRLDEEDGLIY